mgnify:CR=1 FL=1
MCEFNIMNNSNIVFDSGNLPDVTVKIIANLATYFSDMFYNAVYEQAKDMYLNKKCSSIEDGYKNWILIFRKAIDNRNQTAYDKMVNSIAEQFKTSVEKTKSKILAEFKPNSVAFVSTQGETYMRQLMIEISQKCILGTLSSLDKILENRPDEKTKMALTKSFFEEIRKVRESFILKFAAPASTGTVDSARHLAVYNAYKNECEEKASVKAQNMQLQEENKNLREEIKVLSQKIAVFKKTSTELVNHLKEVMAENEQLKMQSGDDDAYFQPLTIQSIKPVQAPTQQMPTQQMPTQQMPTQQSVQASAHQISPIQIPQVIATQKETKKSRKPSKKSTPEPVVEQPQRVEIVDENDIATIMGTSDSIFDRM